MVILNIAELIPKNHLLRKINQVIWFTRHYGRARPPARQKGEGHLALRTDEKAADSADISHFYDASHTRRLWSKAEVEEWAEPAPQHIGNGDEKDNHQKAIVNNLRIPAQPLYQNPSHG